MLGHHLRRRPNINQTLVQRPALAGTPTHTAILHPDKTSEKSKNHQHLVRHSYGKLKSLKQSDDSAHSAIPQTYVAVSVGGVESRQARNVRPMLA